MSKSILLFAFCLGLAACAFGQQPENPAKPAVTYSGGPSTQAGAPSVDDSVMVTIILKHQQDKNLAEIRRVLEAQGFWELFPPEEAHVVSWTLAMNLGHIITLRLPAGAVRRLNLALENGAWGAFDTEIYLSYDYRPVWEDYVQRREEAKEDRN